MSLPYRTSAKLRCGQAEGVSGHQTERLLVQFPPLTASCKVS